MTFPWSQRNGLKKKMEVAKEEALLRGLLMIRGGWGQEL